MQRLKLMIILGTRPEIIRLSEVIKACDRHFDLVFVHTGQNWDYTLSELFFEELEVRRPDYFLNCPGKHLGETMGNIVSASYGILVKERPDALLILGDTNSALSAISAKRLKIPIFHMEAGNRCFDLNVPEEINRTIVDHISDVNMAYTEHSRRYLLDEGLPGSHIFVTGSPIPEVLWRNEEKIKNSQVLKDLNLKPKEFFLISAHREENMDDEKNFLSLMEAVNSLAETYNLPVIYSTHPRSRKTIERRGFQFHALVKNLPPFGFFDYSKLQQNACCVLSDSGTLSEESALLHFPAVLIRTSTERPEVLDKGSIVIGGIEAKQIHQSVCLAREAGEQPITPPLPCDYEDRNVSVKVVKLIQSYTGVIDRDTWRKGKGI